MSRYTLDETDDWYEVIDEEGDVVAQFVEFEDARWYANEKFWREGDTE